MEQPQDIRPDWLKGLAEKTWNLELLISGAATYFTAFLPNLTDKAFHFFLHNMQGGLAADQTRLPVLAYGFAKVIAMILPATFVVHFAMRAFWAGLVGLHTVYPQGIQYDKLPGQRAFVREEYARKFGPLSNYIYRLDRLCNQTFAFAFTIVLFGLGMSMVYLLFFALNFFMKPWLGEEATNFIINVFFGGLAIFSLAMQGLGKWLEKNERPMLKKWVTTFMYYFPQMMLPIVFVPLSYLNMTFSSNVSKLKFYSVMMGMMVVIMSLFALVIIPTIGKLKGAGDILTPQTYFTNRANAYTLQPAQYDASRKDTDPIEGVILPSELVEGPLMKVFVAYPKQLDIIFETLCPLPNLDSLPRKRMRQMRDSLSANCMSNSLQLTVNDSVYKQLDWVFLHHPADGTTGIAGYLPTKQFKNGKNVLKMWLPVPNHPDSIQVLGEVPFWFGGM